VTPSPVHAITRRVLPPIIPAPLLSTAAQPVIFFYCYAAPPDLLPFPTRRSSDLRQRRRRGIDAKRLVSCPCGSTTSRAPAQGSKIGSLHEPIPAKRPSFVVSSA